MAKYNDLQEQILDSLTLDKNSASLIISLYDGTVHNYEIDLSKNEKYPEIIENIKTAILLFINNVISNPNFDTTNLETNLNKNIVIGIDMEENHDHAGITVFDESKNMFGIFADYDLVKTGVIYHELFHLASRPKTKHTFPRGLKEGYTEALAHHYFQKEKISYPDNVIYALELEKIVGKSIMEQAYSKGDIAIIKEALELDTDDINFNIFCQNLDLLLGSYYRVNRDNILPDEEKRTKRAKNQADEYLNKLINNRDYSFFRNQNKGRP